MEGALPPADVLFDGIFDPAIQVAGKAVTAATGLAVVYFRLRAAVIGRDQAAYSVATHLPQGFDRAAFATLRGQRQLVGVIDATLRIKQTKEKLKKPGLTTAEKQDIFMEMFSRSIAHVLVSSYCFSVLACALSVRRAIVVLDYIREVQAVKRQTEHNSWSSLLQGAAQTAVISALQSSLGASGFGASPFDRDNNTGAGSDAHVAAALERQIPLLVELAVQVAVSELAGSGLPSLKAKCSRETVMSILRNTWRRFEDLADFKVQPFARGEFRHCSGALAQRSGATSFFDPSAPAAVHIHASVETIDASGHIVDEAEVDLVEGLRSSSTETRRRQTNIRGGWPEWCLRDLDEVLSSAQFRELAVTSGSEMFDDFVAILDGKFPSFASYDAGDDAAPLISIVLATDISSQKFAEVTVPVPDYVRFFCEEMVRTSAR